MLYIFSTWRTYWLIPLIIEFVNCVMHIITKQNCTIETIGNMKCTNCMSEKKQIHIQKFPSDLGTEITCLYTYNLLISKIGSEAFEKYPSLTHLYMIQNGFDDFAKNTLNPLKRLLYLNLTDTNRFKNSEITWPTTLRILDVTRFRINTLVAPDLNLLEVVNVSETGLTEFPTLSEMAPLKLIVLHNVNMTNFKVDALAKYCKLQSLSTLNLTLGNNCQCLQMKAWLEKWNIKIIHDLNCKPDSTCKVEFSETSMKNRDHCLSQNSISFLFIIIIAAITVFVLIMAGASFLYNKLLNIEEEEEIQYPSSKNSDGFEEELANDDEGGGIEK